MPQSQDHVAIQKESQGASLQVCSCGSAVFEKITEMRGRVVDLLTVTKRGVKTKRVANQVRVEREPRSVTCAGCGKRTSVGRAQRGPITPLLSKNSDSASVSVERDKKNLGEPGGVEK